MGFSFKNFLTEGKERHYGLDVLRAVAILSVILYHYPRHESQLILRGISHFGYWGVDLFFVLSGFLIGGQCFKAILKKGNLNKIQFYTRRFLRTLPNYYAFLLIVVLIDGSVLAFEKFDWRYLFFLQNINGLYYQGHTWSLCIEEHFYLLFPFFSLFMCKLKNYRQVVNLVAGIILAGIILRAFIWFFFRPDIIYHQNVDQGFEIYFKYIYYPTFSRLDGLLVGVFLAFTKYYNSDLWAKFISKGNTRLIQGGVLVIISAIFSFYKIGWANTIFSFPLVAIGFGLILLSSQGQNCIINRLKLPGITLISVLSYSLYLSHVYGFDFASHIIKNLSLAEYGFMAAVVRCVVIFASGFLMFSMIERPFLYFREYVLHKNKEKNASVSKDAA